MKKAVQYSDKFGMVVEAGVEPEERTAPGVAFKAFEPVAPVAKVEEKVVEEKVVEEKVKKKASRAKSSSDDK